VVDTGGLAFTVGGSSGSGGALSAPGESAGGVGSLKFSAPVGVLLLATGFVSEFEDALG